MTKCCEQILNLVCFCCVLCQMKELIMNQEKLAKLQAQVRIGGKVGAYWQISERKSLFLVRCHQLTGLWAHVLQLIVLFCRGQPAGRRRWCTEQPLQMTRSCSSPSRNWESTTSLALRRYCKTQKRREIFYIKKQTEKLAGVLSFWVKGNLINFPKQSWHTLRHSPLLIILTLNTIH